MVVSQILNNNVAVVKRGSNEVIVYAKGVAFLKKVGDRIEEHDIQKTYVLDSHDMLEHFSYIISHSDPNDMVLINEVIAYAQQLLNLKVSDYLSLAMLDHLTFLFKRCEKNQFIKSPLIWDIKKFYPNHFKVGLFALTLIEKNRGISLPHDEAVSIALHFVNMETDGIHHTHEEIQALSDIVSIINLHFKTQIDEQSINYMRLVTHLQYFIQRVIGYEIGHDDCGLLDLYKQVSGLYPESFKCTQKIRVFVQSQFGVDISINEETYLILHINRVTQRLEEK